MTLRVVANRRHSRAYSTAWECVRMIGTIREVKSVREDPSGEECKAKFTFVMNVLS